MNRPKKLTPTKIDRAREGLDALLECEDLERFFSVQERASIIEAKNVLKPGKFDEIVFGGGPKS